jgi:hypothetical protein
MTPPYSNQPTPCWSNNKEFADFLHIFTNETAILKLKGMKALA